MSRWGTIGPMTVQARGTVRGPLRSQRGRRATSATDTRRLAREHAGYAALASRSRAADRQDLNGGRPGERPPLRMIRVCQATPRAPASGRGPTHSTVGRSRPCSCCQQDAGYPGYHDRSEYRDSNRPHRASRGRPSTRGQTRSNRGTTGLRLPPRVGLIRRGEANHMKVRKRWPTWSSRRFE